MCNNNQIEQVVATQVKGDFGDLRFKCIGDDGSTWTVVLFAERKSKRISQITGNVA